MSQQKTHREAANPEISVRYLADYMAALAQGRQRAARTIIRGCKYRPIARIVQHDEAQLAASKFIVSGEADAQPLLDAAAGLRARIADNQFERDVLDHNVDYLERFAAVCDGLNMPKADLLP